MLIQLSCVANNTCVIIIYIGISCNSFDDCFDLQANLIDMSVIFVIRVMSTMKSRYHMIT